MKPECPYYRAPGYYVNPVTEEDFDTAAMCDLMDKPCVAEYGVSCETYAEYCRELEGTKESD